MAAKIPQDVTREDRLIGPLTLKQFLYLLVGGAVIFIAYQYYSLQYLFLIEFVVISFVFGSLTLALAFAKINGLPFGQFMSHAFKFFLAPKQRTWSKDINDHLTVQKDDIANIPTTQASRSKTAPESQLELLANVLDTGGKINEATATNHKVGAVGENIVAVNEPAVEDVLSEVDEI